MAMSMPAMVQPLSPYAIAADAYLQRGWLGVLPLPPRQKAPVPEGFTGKVHWDIDPTPEMIAKWKTRPGANIGLRMPRNILGIDVDAYGNKPGRLSLEDAESDFGQLPPTWRSTSRDDGISGIRFYRVPEGLQWPNTVGPGIETVHRGHRYAVAFPSIHPDTGVCYRWITPEGATSMEIPSVSELAELPEEWVLGLTQGEAMRPAPRRGSVDWGTVRDWLTDGRPCRQVAKVESRFRDAMAQAGSRHDAARDLMLATLFLGQQGHSGVKTALSLMGDLYVSTVSEDRGGTAPAITEWDHMEEGAQAIVAGSPRSPELCGGDTCGEIQPLEGLPVSLLPRIVPPSELARQASAEVLDRLWEARPELAHIKNYAHASRTSPWAVLGLVLARVVCQVGPAIVLPPMVGGEASLNLFVGVVGPSGSGKGAAESAARSAFRYGSHQTEVTLGSGEGIAHSYMRWVPPKKEEPGGVEQIETSVYFKVAEVDTIAALKGRSSATLLPQLRSAWSGETLGFGYAAVEKRLMVPAHQYRLCLSVGIQPMRAGALLETDEADGGTPQRFLWVNANDPDAPEERPPLPRPMEWRQPSWNQAITDPATGRRLVAVCSTARTEIDDAAYARLRGDVDALDGHRLLAKLKVAAALAILDGRAGVEDPDWELAEIVMTASDQTREAIQQAIKRAAAEQSRSRARARGEEQIIVTEMADQRAIASTKASIQRIIGKTDDGSITRSALRKSLSRKGRELMEEALASLEDENLVRVSGTANGQGATVVLL